MRCRFQQHDVDLLLGDLASSINDFTDYNLWDRLNDFYESIESEVAIQHRRPLH